MEKFEINSLLLVSEKMVLVSAEWRLDQFAQIDRWLQDHICMSDDFFKNYDKNLFEGEDCSVSNPELAKARAKNDAQK